MLKWKPKDRSSARDLLSDPWLQDGENYNVWMSKEHLKEFKIVNHKKFPGFLDKLRKEKEAMENGETSSIEIIPKDQHKKSEESAGKREEKSNESKQKSRDEQEPAEENSDHEGDDVDNPDASSSDDDESSPYESGQSDEESSSSGSDEDSDEDEE